MKENPENTRKNIKIRSDQKDQIGPHHPTIVCSFILPTSDGLPTYSSLVSNSSFNVQTSNLLVSLLLVAMPGAPSSFLFLVAMPGAPGSVLQCPNSPLPTGANSSSSRTRSPHSSDHSVPP